MPATRSSAPDRLVRLLFLVGASLLLAAGVEWEAYRQLIQWKSLAAGTLDRVAMFWMIWSKTVCLLAIVLLTAEVLQRCSSHRLARVTWLTGSGAVLTWLLLDLRVQDATGNHLLDYAAFLTDASTWQWAGGGGGLVAPLLTVVGGAVVLVAGLDWLARRLARKLAAAGQPWPERASGGLVATAAAAALGVVPVQYALADHVAVQQLHAVLACNPLGGLVAEVQQGVLGRFRAQVDEQSAQLFHELQHHVQRVPPADLRACDFGARPPNVIIILLESLRHDVFEQGMMPRVAAWSEGGLRLGRHYAGGNASHLGLFALLYGRSPLLYQATLDAQVPPQACETFRRAGYACTFLSSGTTDWMRMNEYLCAPHFDCVELHQDTTWPDDDRTLLCRIGQLAKADKPQLIVAFFMSTHLPYVYPPEFEHHRPVVPPEEVVATAKARRSQIMNRYRNAAGFLDHELAALLAELDPQRNIVVISGDHGESLFDDGSLSHWGRLSEIQTRTPMVIVGPGVPRAAIPTATTHADLLPTLVHALAGKPVPLAHAHGRDLLDGCQPDQVLICTMAKSRALAGSQVWDALLIRQQERLHLKIGLRPPQIRVLGFFDTSGRFDPQQGDAPHDAAVWSTALRAEWQKLAR